MVNGNVIEVVEEFIYLGVLIKRDGTVKGNESYLARKAKGKLLH